MNKYDTKIILLFFLLLIIGIENVSASDAPQKVTINLPGNKKVNFRAVYLDIDGDAIFASRRIKIGSGESESYKIQLADVLLAGSFVGKRKNQNDWLYYIGETEICQEQWEAVMSWHEERKTKACKYPKRPKTGVTIAEVYTFIEALNSWMLSKEKNNLPRYKKSLAFCRLPTEAEWEFAARGGVQVRSDVFSRRHPYTDEEGKEASLGSYEWSRESSGNKVQDCGSKHLKANPIGLYDMLGNVEELTLSLFSPDYVQGRFGNFVIRGGNFSLSADELSVSRRIELLPFIGGGKPHRAQKVGFRLVLGTSISASGLEAEELDQGYLDYLDTKDATGLGSSKNHSRSEQAKQDVIHLGEKELSNLKFENEKLIDQINLLEDDRKKTESSLRLAKMSSKNLEDKLTSKKREISDLKNQISLLIKKNNIEFDKVRFSSLQSKISDLELKLKNVNNKISIEGNLVGLVKISDRQLAKKDQKIADLKRKLTLLYHEIRKNAGRVRDVEKRYLEALMRQASANAYLGFRNLKALEILKASNSSYLAKKISIKQKEGEQMVRAYCELVIQIATETQKELFFEVKKELSKWLRDREAKNSFGYQRKSLDLLERHISDIYNGNYPTPEGLIVSFPSEPEFNR